MYSIEQTDIVPELVDDGKKKELPSGNELAKLEHDAKSKKVEMIIGVLQWVFSFVDECGAKKT